jgi:hypothetical protein
MLLGFEVDTCGIAGTRLSQDDLTKKVEGKKKYFEKKVAVDFQNSIIFKYKNKMIGE